MRRLDWHRPPSGTTVPRPAVQRAAEGLRLTLANERERSFAYVSPRFPSCEPFSIFLGGGGAGLPGLTEFVRTSLGLEITHATPAQLAPCAQPARRWIDDSSLLTAIGLMMWKGGPS